MRISSQSSVGKSKDKVKVKVEDEGNAMFKVPDFML